MVLLLSRDDLLRLLDLDAVITAVEHGFAAYSAGQTDTPPRTSLTPPGSDGVTLVMPCAVAAPAALGTKVVSVFPGNVALGLPTVTALYALCDHQTGVPLAVMDGGALTALRTAAGSAVATRHSARPDARTLGIFGTGVQAYFHALALCRVRSMERILVAGTSGAKERDFCGRVADAVGRDASPASPAEVSAADVVAACTTSPTPVVLDQAVRPGAHVNAVGAFTPTTRELPSALVARASVYVDTRAGALSEAGDLLIPAQEGAFSLDQVRGETGDVILGRIAGRRDTDEITVYKSVGAAFLDAVTARLAYDRALAVGAGTPFELT